MAELRILVGDRSLIAFDILKENAKLLELPEENDKQEKVKEALTAHQELMTAELLAIFEKQKIEKK